MLDSLLQVHDTPSDTIEGSTSGLARAVDPVHSTLWYWCG